MTSSHEEQMIELFGLNKEEKILHEFKSSLVETVPILGDLYLTDNYICFYSNLFFFNRNISIPLNEITQLSLNKANIEIKSKDKNYSFSSTEEITLIFEKMKSKCHSYNEAYRIKNDLIPIIIIDSENTDNEDLISRQTTASSNFSHSPSKEILNDILEENEEEIKFVPIEQDVDIEICRKIIDISPSDLFNKYFCNSNPETCHEKYFEWVGDHTNIKISDWEKIETDEKSNLEKFKKTESFSLALHGVPLVDHSEISKTSIYYIDNDGTFYISDSSKSGGIPFADCFTIESKIELHPYMKGTKTVYRTYVRTNLLKSTFFKPLLISQTKTSYTNEVNKWLEFIQEKGEKIEGDYIYKPKKTETFILGSDSNNSDKEKTPLLNETETEKEKEKNNEECNIGYKEFTDNCKCIYEKTFKKTNNKNVIVFGFSLLLFILLIIIIKKMMK